MTVTISYETAPTMSSRRQIQIESMYELRKMKLRHYQYTSVTSLLILTFFMRYFVKYICNRIQYQYKHSHILRRPAILFNVPCLYILKLHQCQRDVEKEMGTTSLSSASGNLISGKPTCRSYRNDEFDSLFLLPDSIMCVMEV